LTIDIVGNILADPNTQRYFEVLSNVEKSLLLKFPYENLEAELNNFQLEGSDPMAIIAEYTTLSLKELNAIRYEEALILNSLHSTYGEEVQELLLDEAKSDYFTMALQDAYKDFLSAKNLKMNNVCGPDLDLACEGSRDCYYGNNLDTYLDGCKDRANTAGWRVFQGSVATGVAVGAGAGAFAAGVGAAPGSIFGGVVGFAAGVVGGFITSGVLGQKCRYSLHTLCRGCKARCWEP